MLIKSPRITRALVFLTGWFVGVVNAQVSATPLTSVLPEVRVRATPSADAQAAYQPRLQGAATFLERPILDTPFQVNVFSERLFTDQLARGLNDISRNDPATVPSTGVGLGTFETVNIRGFELHNWSGYRRDGLMFANQAQTPIENKERVEIIKGLSALRYGFTNPGGVVNWVLKRPTAQPLARLNLNVNQFGAIGAHVDLGGRTGPDSAFGYRFNAVAERESLYVDDVDGRRYMASVFLDWRLSPNLVLEFETEYQDREIKVQPTIGFTSFPVGQARVPLDIDPARFWGQQWGVYPTRTHNTSARLLYSLTPDWSLRAAVQYSDLWRDQRAPGIRARTLQRDNSFEVTTFFAPDQYRRALTTETVLEGRLRTGSVLHEVAFGHAYMDHRIGGTASRSLNLGFSSLVNPRPVPAPNVDPGPVFEQLRQIERAWFAANYVTFSPEWSGFLGIRRTTPHYRTFNAAGATTAVYDRSATSPSAGLVFKPRPDISLYISGATGIEQGGTAPVGTTNAGQVLPPLESRQWEVGAKADVLAGLTLSGAYFRINKGLEYTDPATNTFVQDGRQLHRGLEFSFTGSLTGSLRAVGGFMLLDPEVARTGNLALIGKRPVSAPTHTASIFLDHDIAALPGWSVSGGLLRVSRRAVDANNTLFIPAFTRFDLGTRYVTTLMGRKTTLRAFVENVTDERYFSTASFGAMVFGSPRAARASATIDF
jgi:iron complex outermembrane receptor protein